MMRLLYNIIQMTALVIFAPVLLVFVAVLQKYRARILDRLGFRVFPWPVADVEKPRIWIHALSVGEVFSAIPLVRAIRNDLPGACIVFSATTRTGEAKARAGLQECVDFFCPFPLDILYSVRRIVDMVSPDVFILVETDFWPNFLAELERRKIPAVLVNGRMSSSSYDKYRRFKYFFLPMFASFKLLSMQTARDVERMISFGLPPDKVRALGNLKFDAALPDLSKKSGLTLENLGLKGDPDVMVAGSTHRGEEDLLLAAYLELKEEFPELKLIIAPRKINRGEEICILARQKGFRAGTRTEGAVNGADVIVLDTLGELSQVYGLATVAFVGGSMVDEGGHNPLEPAAQGKPVLFGKHMEDFSEVAAGLVESGCAGIVKGAEDLIGETSFLLKNPMERAQRGKAGASFVAENTDVAQKHVAVIRELLGKRAG